MKKMEIRELTLAAVVAALYAALSWLGGMFGISFGAVQCRFAEALCVLPWFFPETSWGLFAGCLLANTMSAYGPVDIIFGSLATLSAAVITSRVKSKYLAPLPPVIINGIVVSAVVAASQSGGDSFFAAWGYNALTIAVGEAAACYGLGTVLLLTVPKIPALRERMGKEKL